MNAIALHNITKRFGSHVAVDNLSLEVPAGSVYGFIGLNSTSCCPIPAESTCSGIRAPIWHETK